MGFEAQAHPGKGECEARTSEGLSSREAWAVGPPVENGGRRSGTGPGALCERRESTFSV